MTPTRPPSFENHASARICGVLTPDAAHSFSRPARAEREAQHELEAAHPGEKILCAGRFPAVLALALGEPERSLTPVLVLRGAAAGRAAPDEGASARRGRGGDEILMLALDRRVGDLEDVEDTHGDVVRQVRRDPGHPDEADLALVAQGQQLPHRLGCLHLSAAGRHVGLHEIEPVGAEPVQTLFDTGPDVGCAVVVRERWRGARGRAAEEASALRRQEVLVTAVGEVPADELLRPRGRVSIVMTARYPPQDWRDGQRQNRVIGWRP
jgi:hypothetical protein